MYENTMSHNHYIGEVYKWNWLAFLFTPIWAIADKVWFALIVFTILAFLVPPLAFLFSIAMGIYGSRLAYDRFDGDEKAFYNRKPKWIRAIFVSILISVILAVPGFLSLMNERSVMTETIELLNNDPILVEHFDGEDFESLVSSWSKNKLSSKLTIYNFTIIDGNKFYFVAVDIRDGDITDLHINEFGDDPGSFEYRMQVN